MHIDHIELFFMNSLNYLLSFIASLLYPYGYPVILERYFEIFPTEFPRNHYQN